MKNEYIHKIVVMVSEIDLAREFFRQLLDRNNNVNITKVDTILNQIQINNKPISRYNAVSFIKKLSEYGCGRFVIGRRGQPSRLEWDVDALELARAVLQPNAVTQIPNTEPVATESEARKSDPDLVLAVLEHTFILRPDFPVKLSLPANLTPHEAARLSRFVEALPMEGNPKSE
jgi:hypothetical protein